MSRICCAGLEGATRKAHTLRKGAATHNGVDSNGNPNGEAYLRRRGCWPSEIQAISICQQFPPVRIAAAVAPAKTPKPFASATRGCSYISSPARRGLMIADRRLL